MGKREGEREGERERKWVLFLSSDFVIVFPSLLSLCGVFSLVDLNNFAFPENEYKKENREKHLGVKTVLWVRKRSSCCARERKREERERDVVSV